MMAEAYDEGVVSEVIRPAAIVPEEAARAVLVEPGPARRAERWRLAVGAALWSLYDRPWHGYDNPAGAEPHRHHPGRLRHAHQVRDHHLPRHRHPVRRRQRLDRHLADRRRARVRRAHPRRLPPRHPQRPPRPFRF
nr:hypothetical protein [Angustibacter aerolatus]